MAEKNYAPELVICSIGLRTEQATLETVSALKKCRAVFTQLDDPSLRAFLSRLGPEIITEKSGDPAAVAAGALAALKKHSPLAFLTYGNPFFINHPAWLLARKARAAGARVRVLDAVSSVDAIFNLLGLNGPSSGNDVRLVNLAEFDELEPSAAMDTLYFMPGGANCGRHRRNLDAFARWAAAAYPPSFRFSFITCPCPEAPGGLVSPVRVRDLPLRLAGAGLAATVYAPRLKKKSRRR